MVRARTHTHTHTRVSVWSVSFDWRETCLPSWCNRKHYGRVSQRYRFESRRGQWALFSLIPSALSFVFLWHTHTHTHARTHARTHTHTPLPLNSHHWLFNLCKFKSSLLSVLVSFLFFCSHSLIAKSLSVPRHKTQEVMEVLSSSFLLLSPPPPPSFFVPSFSLSHCFSLVTPSLVISFSLDAICLFVVRLMIAFHMKLQVANNQTVCPFCKVWQGRSLPTQYVSFSLQVQGQLTTVQKAFSNAALDYSAQVSCTFIAFQSED